MLITAFLHFFLRLNLKRCCSVIHVYVKYQIWAPNQNKQRVWKHHHQQQHIWTYCFICVVLGWISCWPRKGHGCKYPCVSCRWKASLRWLLSHHWALVHDIHVRCPPLPFPPPAWYRLSEKVGNPRPLFLPLITTQHVKPFFIEMQFLCRTEMWVLKMLV